MATHLDYHDIYVKPAEIEYLPPPEPRYSRVMFAIKKEHDAGNHTHCWHDEHEQKIFDDIDKYLRYVETGEFEPNYGYRTKQN